MWRTTWRRDDDGVFTRTPPDNDNFHMHTFGKFSTVVYWVGWFSSMVTVRKEVTVTTSIGTIQTYRRVPIGLTYFLLKIFKVSFFRVEGCEFLLSTVTTHSIEYSLILGMSHDSLRVNRRNSADKKNFIPSWYYSVVKSRKVFIS